LSRNEEIPKNGQHVINDAYTSSQFDNFL